MGELVSYALWLQQQKRIAKALPLHLFVVLSSMAFVEVIGPYLKKEEKTHYEWGTGEEQQPSI